MIPSFEMAGMSRRSAPTRSCPWLRQGLANQIDAADFDASVKVRATRRRQARRVTGDKLGGGTDDRRRRASRSRSSGPATSSASTGARSSGSSRATGSPTSSPTTSPHDRVLRRGLPLALHAGRAGPGDGPAAPVARARRARGGASSPTGTTSQDQPLPYVDVADLGVVPHGRRAVGVGARARQPQPGRATTTEFVSHRHGAR